MMKIFAISNNFNALSNIRLNKTKQDNISARSTFQTFPSQNILANYKKFNIHFGNNIDIEYFRLPKNARPDEYQISAAKSLDNGNSVLVSAPTGTGKTAIAQYIISKNLTEGKKTFYTTPLKALSNQKLLEFRKIYGDENVGILTGDRKENPDAPIIVMTTEVYRNMAFEEYFGGKKTLAKEAKTIIFDEFHYLGDKERGSAWEEGIIFSSPNTQILGLSATIGNDSQLSDWLDTINTTGVKLVQVPQENRHVPLDLYEYDTEQQKLIPQYPGMLELEYLKEGGFYQNRNVSKHAKSHSKSKLAIDDNYFNLIDKLSYQDKLPAIFFIFSKKDCRDLLAESLFIGSDLTTNEEREKIALIIDKYKEKYKYLGEDLDEEALMCGYAMHHSGLLPVQKELVEELFNKKLVKVVFATETLAAGINMPARTVVISSPDKPSSDPNAENGRRTLTPNEYHQMAGRAGRRGIDTKGNVINFKVNADDGAKFKDLVLSSPNSIYSSFYPDYSLIASYHKYEKNAEAIKEILSKSFKIFATEKAENKIRTLHKMYEAKSNVMQAEGYLFINKDKEKFLTSKGLMLHNIVGYQQIPLINLISTHALQKITPEELVLFAASIICGQCQSNNEDIVENKIIPPAKLLLNSPVLKNECNKNNADKFQNIEKTIIKYNNFNENYQQNLSRFGIDDEIAQPLSLKNGALIYAFAYLNSQNTNESVKNWQKILPYVQHSDIKDEGGFYNAINQTIDLLSQMIDLCHDTKNIYDLKNDRMYYKILADKLKIAILLLKQDPMQSFSYEK